MAPQDEKLVVTHPIRISEKDITTELTFLNIFRHCDGGWQINLWHSSGIAGSMRYLELADDDVIIQKACSWVASYYGENFGVLVVEEEISIQSEVIDVPIRLVRITNLSAT